MKCLKSRGTYLECRWQFIKWIIKISAGEQQNADGEHIYPLPEMIGDEKKAMRNLLFVAAICLIFMIVEVVGGYLANSLAIMTDAAHLFGDISGFFISIFSIWLSQIAATQRMSYGYFRAEIIGAMSSVILIWGLTIWLVKEAYGRIINTQQVDARIMFLIATLGFIFNLIMMKVLHGAGHGHSHEHGHSHNHSHNNSHNNSHDHSHDHVHEATHDHNNHKHDNEHGNQVQEPITGSKEDKQANQEHQSHQEHDHAHQIDQHHHNEDAHSHKNMNVRAAMIHVIGDTIQSVGVIIASLIIYSVPNAEITDPICTFIFSIIVLFTTIPITKDCIAILMEGSIYKLIWFQATPKNFQIEKFTKSLESLPNVGSIHDLHVWGLSTSKVAVSVHITTLTPPQTLYDAIKLCKSYGIDHSTIQVENPEDNKKFDINCEKSLKCF